MTDAALPPQARWWDRVLVWVATHGNRSAKVGRWLVGGMAALAVVLGTWGWAQMEPGPGHEGRSWLTIAYGVGGMFVFAGSDVENVSTPLQWARVIAPLATAGAAIGLILAAGDARLRRLAARRARGHIVLIGPAQRVAVHASAAETDPIVHADPSAGRSHERSIHVAFDATDPTWAARLSAGRAGRIVVATGADDINIALVGSLWRLQGDHPGLDVTIEIDDRSVALSLAAALAVEDPDRPTHVLCPDDLAARVAADRVVGELAVDRMVVVAGDGPLGELLAAHLARALRVLYFQESRFRYRLAVLEASDASHRHLQRVLAEDDAVVLQRYRTLSELISATEQDVVAVVDHRDRARSYRMAVELAWARPGSAIFLHSDATDLPLGLRSLNLAGLIDRDLLVDPWARAAARWIERTTGAPAADEQARIEQARAIRRLVSDLVGTAGWRIAPEDSDAPGVQTINRATLATIRAADTWGDLAHILRDEGFTLHPPATEEHDHP